jgi:putative intracellular protease/amidase
MNTSTITLITGAALAAAFTTPAAANEDASSAPDSRVLFVVTSHDRKGAEGGPTGYYLSELTHPYQVLVDAGHVIEVASPKGGQAPVDGFDLEDPVNRAFWQNPAARAKVEHTQRIAELDAARYDAVFIVGGHGTMWDLPDDAALARVIASIYERGGVVGAVCHGPSALVNVRLSDGRWLVADHQVSAFTNSEERAVGLDRTVPFLLADRLIERGAIHVPAADFQSQVVVSGRLVTGQNPASATGVGEAMARLLADRKRAQTTP